MKLIQFSQLFSLVFTGKVVAVGFSQEESVSMDFKIDITLSLGSDSTMKFFNEFSFLDASFITFSSSSVK